MRVRLCWLRVCLWWIVRIRLGLIWWRRIWWIIIVKRSYWLNRQLYWCGIWFWNIWFWNGAIRSWCNNWIYWWICTIWGSTIVTMTVAVRRSSMFLYWLVSWLYRWFYIRLYRRLYWWICTIMRSVTVCRSCMSIRVLVDWLLYRMSFV